MYKRVKCVEDLRLREFIIKKGDYYSLDFDTQRLQLIYCLDVQLTKLQMNHFKEIK